MAMNVLNDAQKLIINIKKNMKQITMQTQCDNLREVASYDNPRDNYLNLNCLAFPQVYCCNLSYSIRLKKIYICYTFIKYYIKYNMNYVNKVFYVLYV